MLFQVSGVVRPYRGNGRAFGYPTANIPIASDTPEGLFIGTVTRAEQELPALVFVGSPITLEDDEKRAEAHILNFEDQDLYGEELTFTVLEKIRDNQQFDSTEALIEQMNQDKQIALAYFKEEL